MYKITNHPILDVSEGDFTEFEFEGKIIRAEKNHMIAAALHQAGYNVHNHSVKGRNRSLGCGIGKCGACEMLVDGRVKRICITMAEGVKKVERRTDDSSLKAADKENPEKKIYKTTVAIVGAGPAGLAAREELNKAGVDNLVIDNNPQVGGQFNMQTHQFFFFEKERRFGGMRGFDIAKTLAGEDESGILLNCVVWDVLEGKRLAVKNIENGAVFYVDADHLVVAAGAVPFMPPFKNDDLPGVYTAAVFQKMMNREKTLLGKNVLTVGAGNIGYLTSYQAMQAGAKVKAILEGMPHEGGFPVQANRVRRLGIPIYTSHVLLEAIPNEDHTGIVGAIVAKCENFKPIPGSEMRIDGIDCINVCTGLIPDGRLLKKGNEVFGRACYGVGDAVRIGEGTSAVLRGRQCAYEILQSMGLPYNYNDYLTVSREYIDSQQRPTRVLESPRIPSEERMTSKGFVIADCLYGFACNPCSFSCRQGAITKLTTSSVPMIDFDKCIGCMECVTSCPGLAMFGFNPAKNLFYLPVEYDVTAGAEVFLIDNNGSKIGEGVIKNVVKKPNKTNLAVVSGKVDDTLSVRGFIVKENYPEPLELTATMLGEADTYVCHCEDVTEESLIAAVGDRKSITAAELKHITRIGMGVCRGSRCLARARQVLRNHGITLVGEFTPRGPMANPVEIGELINEDKIHNEFIVSDKVCEAEVVKCGSFVAGGGMAGSAMFRYLAEAGMSPVLANMDAGSSWRCIAGGRPAFSVPALADIANNNYQIFKELQREGNINLKETRYVNFVHDQASYDSLDKSREWSDAYMIDRRDFKKEISEYFDDSQMVYSHALISKGCWQATPGLTIDLVRHIGINAGGILMENTSVEDVVKDGNIYKILVKLPGGKFRRYETEVFVNALGAGGEKIASRMGIETGLYPVKHQAFITKRLPLIGKDGDSLDMLIDRRKYKGFSAVYGQQMAETGQIIGCASPGIDAIECGKNLKFNSKEFIEIVSEVFCMWIPALKNVEIQAVWSGYYTEPRYIVDPDAGLFLGMRGHGFMLSQYIAKLYVDKLRGLPVPEYFSRLALGGDGLSENAFK